MIRLVSSPACTLPLLLLLLGPSFDFGQTPPLQVGTMLPHTGMRMEKQGTLILDAIVDRIPAVSQEATWTWWNRP
jgi:hypothetical protein